MPLFENGVRLGHVLERGEVVNAVIVDTAIVEMIDDLGLVSSVGG